MIMMKGTSISLVKLGTKNSANTNFQRRIQPRIRIDGWIVLGWDSSLEESIPVMFALIFRFFSDRDTHLPARGCALHWSPHSDHSQLQWSRVEKYGSDYFFVVVVVVLVYAGFESVVASAAAGGRTEERSVAVGPTAAGAAIRRFSLRSVEQRRFARRFAADWEKVSLQLQHDHHHHPPSRSLLCSLPHNVNDGDKHWVSEWSSCARGFFLAPSRGKRGPTTIYPLSYPTCTCPCHPMLHSTVYLLCFAPKTAALFRIRWVSKWVCV